MLSPLGKAVALACSLAMCVVAGCLLQFELGLENPLLPIPLHLPTLLTRRAKIAGVTAKGKLGEKADHLL